MTTANFERQGRVGRLRERFPVDFLATFLSDAWQSIEMPANGAEGRIALKLPEAHHHLEDTMATVRRSATAVLLGTALVLPACDGGGDRGLPENPPASDSGGVLDDHPGAGDRDTADVEPSDRGGAEGGDVVATDASAPDPADYPGMDENTPEGAEQAFKYYIAVLMWSYQSGDSDLLRSLESENCSVCAQNAADLDEYQSGGGYWTDVTIDDVRLEARAHDEFDMEVRYDFAVSPHAEYSDEQIEGEQIPRTEYVTAAGLDWADGEWLLGDVAAQWSEDEHE